MRPLSPLLLCLTLGLASAQVDIPATPLEAVPTAPAVAPAPETPKVAPSTPEVLSAVPVRAVPLLISVQVDMPGLRDGKKVKVPFSSTLTIPGPRVAELRRRGGEISVSLDQDINAFIKQLSAPAQDARFEELSEGWTVVQRNSLVIDEQATRDHIAAALKDPQGVKAAVVVTEQRAPNRTTEFFSTRGITSHLGTGTSNYYGSNANRTANIHVGTKNFKDRLFEGKVVSFNQMIGPISAKNGYLPGLVIAGDRTETGLGGGICQVSTTVFRTLYAAGLPIVERHSHSYQVFYYGKPGLDATIYQPSMDLKMRNDTGGALWFQADWDDAEGGLVISVFGKPRPEEVRILEPRTLKATPAPKDRFIFDAKLKPGEKKQVDWAQPGAVTEVTRQFLKGGKVVRQDVLKSSYRPWPNIFLVGR